MIYLETPQGSHSWPCGTKIEVTARLISLLVRDPDALVEVGPWETAHANAMKSRRVRVSSKVLPL